MVNYIVENKTGLKHCSAQLSFSQRDRTWKWFYVTWQRRFWRCLNILNTFLWSVCSTKLVTYWQIFDLTTLTRSMSCVRCWLNIIILCKCCSITEASVRNFNMKAIAHRQNCDNLKCKYTSCAHEKLVEPLNSIKYRFKSNLSPSECERTTETFLKNVQSNIDSLIMSKFSNSFSSLCLDSASYRHYGRRMFNVHIFMRSRLCVKWSSLLGRHKTFERKFQFIIKFFFARFSCFNLLRYESHQRVSKCNEERRGASLDRNI